MRHLLIILTLILFPSLAWGAYKGLVVLPDEARRESYAYLERQLKALEQEQALDPSTLHTLRDEWERLLSSPLDLRTASLEELMSIPLMSEYRAYQLIRYRQDQRNPLEEYSDLKLIDSWDEDFAVYLYPLVRLVNKAESKSKLSELLNQGQTRASLLFTRPWRSDESTKTYVGTPERLDLRYLWHSAGQLSFSIGASKDNYEPWQYGKHRGFDSYHGHIALSRQGIIKQFILGQYRAYWAEGLILAQGFGSRSLLNDTRHTLTRLSPNRGLSEYHLSQGIALDLQLHPKLRLGIVTSLQGLDAKLNAEDNSFSSVLESGSHRSEAEQAKRQRITARHLGLNLSYYGKRLQLGLQGIHYDWAGRSLSKALGAGYYDRLRNIKRMSNLSLSYRYSSPTAHLNLSGEVATNDLQGIALAQRLVLNNDLLGSLQFIARYITQDYWAYHGQTYSHYARPHNEWGLGLALTPRLSTRHLSLSMEGDYYSDVQARGNRGLHKGYSLRLLASGKIDNSLSWQGRISLRSSTSQGKRWGGTLSSRYRAGKVESEIRLDGSLAHHLGTQHWGTALSLRSNYRWAGLWQIWAGVTLHRVADWSARIYHSEVRLSDEYLSPNLVGQGLRLSLGLRGKLTSHLALGLRLMRHQLTTSQANNTEVALQLTYRSL